MDAWVDDARLVVLNAAAGANHGARVDTRTACIKAVREQTHWKLTLQDQLNGQTFDVTADALVNATGPWVKRLFDETMALEIATEYPLGERQSHYRAADS